MSSLWSSVFQTKLNKERKKEALNEIDQISENLKNFEFPTMVSTFAIDDKHLGDLNSFLSTKKAQFIHPIVSESQDEVNDEAVERAKKIKMKGLDYIYPVFDNAEAFYKDDAKDNHLKLVGAIASTASRWDFLTATGTVHGKVLNSVLPVNVTQASFTKLINSGCAMYTNRKGASFFTESEEGKFFDFWHNVYWIINELQITAFNYIYTTSSKVPYSENGLSDIKSILTYVLERGVLNGSIGPFDYKTITGSPKNEKNILAGISSNGYFIEVNPIDPDEAKKRIAPIINIWVHMVGAVHKLILNIGILK